MSSFLLQQFMPVAILVMAATIVISDVYKYFRNEHQR